MKNLILGLFVLFTLCSCANPFMPMNNANPDLWKDCKDEDCVIDAIDSLPEDQRECINPLWMEGYKMQSLRWLKEHNRLKIERWSDWKKLQLLIIGGYAGESKIKHGEFGDFHSAEVRYVSDDYWNNLAHELMHVAGPCSEIDPIQRFLLQGEFADYTEIQKQIMKLEGKNSWIETDFYFHLINGPWYKQKQFEKEKLE